MRPLFTDDNGRITCLEHGGEALQASYLRNPRKQEYGGAEGTWIRCPSDWPHGCQTCEAERRPMKP